MDQLTRPQAEERRGERRVTLQQGPHVGRREHEHFFPL